MPLKPLVGALTLSLLGCLAHPVSDNPRSGTGSAGHISQALVEQPRVETACSAMSNEANSINAALFLIHGMSQDPPDRAAIDMLLLFAMGEESIPALLQAGLDSRRVAFTFPYPSLLSGMPADHELHPTTGVVCLYLIQSIESKKLFHSSITRNGGADQGAIVTLYSEWWERRVAGQDAMLPVVGWDSLGNSKSELQAFLVGNGLCASKP